MKKLSNTEAELKKRVAYKKQHSPKSVLMHIVINVNCPLFHCDKCSPLFRSYLVSHRLLFYSLPL